MSKQGKKKKFRIKTFKEINEDFKKGWDKFSNDVGQFFGLPPKVDSLEDMLGPENDINGTKPQIGDSNFQNNSDNSPHNTKQTAIDITPDEIWAIIEKNKEIDKEFSVTKAPDKKKELINKWENNWNKFANNTVKMFTDLKDQIDEVNQKNMKLVEEKIKIGKANYRIWLRKQELRNAELKEQQRLALERFKKQQAEMKKRNQEFFEKQQRSIEQQLKKWHEEQKRLRITNKEKWEENQRKFREDYYEWIERRRKRALEKSKYKLQLGWRQTSYILMSLLPFIIVLVIIMAIVNAVMGK